VKNPYTILGVAQDADMATIKAAYRRLARELHPDADPGNPWADQDFQELAAAYELLSDPDRRAEFDRSSADGQSGGRRQPRSGRRRNDTKGLRIDGANLSYDMTVGFLDAARGATQTIKTPEGRELAVRVPPGTGDGDTLRLKGQGMGGLGGGRPGDALVAVHVEPHPVFRRHGPDVRIELSVSLPEAILGARIQAPTVDGQVTVTVPPGSNTGTVLRLRGKGVASGGGARGDQYVSLRVVLPSRPDAELTDFVRAWSARHPYGVRTDDKAVGGA